MCLEDFLQAFASENNSLFDSVEFLYIIYVFLQFLIVFFKKFTDLRFQFKV